MNKRSLLFIIVLLICTSAENIFGLSPSWLWAKSIGGTNDENVYSLATDASGNVYTTGRFSGTVDFDPDSGVFNLTSLGLYDIFISKLDSSGNFVWGKRMGGNADYETAISIAVDDSDYVVTFGTFSDVADFDPDSGVFNLTSAGDNDVFISKLNSSGEFIWAKSVGGALNEYAGSMNIDASGNVYSTGSFKLTVDFDPGPDTFNLVSTGINHTYILKLNSTGNFVWAKTLEGPGGSGSNSIVLDSIGNVYTTGLFYDTIDFDPGIPIFNLISAVPNDIYISKLDSGGNFIFAKQILCTSSNSVRSIAVDASGNIYTTGFYYGTADFDPDSGFFNMTPVGNSDIFISKLNATGNFVWAKSLGGSDYDQGFSIALDGAGNIYVTGDFQSSADFDPGPNAFILTSTGSADIFITKLDSAGNFVWTKSADGTGNDFGSSIAIDASDNVYTTGSFSGNNILFSPYLLTNASPSGYIDFFIVKLDSTILTGNNEIQKNGAGNFIYPNPTFGNLAIVLPGNNTKTVLTIIDITGKIIFTSSTSETQKIDVNTNYFAEGIYLVRLQTSEFCRVSKLVVAR